MTMGLKSNYTAGLERIIMQTQIRDPKATVEYAIKRGWAKMPTPDAPVIVPVDRLEVRRAVRKRIAKLGVVEIGKGEMPPKVEDL